MPQDLRLSSALAFGHRSFNFFTSLSLSSTTRAVFLDRDGTLMEEVDYCGDPAKVRVLPGVPVALQQLRSAGFRLVIITNQSGIGRGYFTEQDFQRVQDELIDHFGDTKLIDATYHCPDAPDYASERRKPAPGMIMEALGDLALDPVRSFMVGDTSADVWCGQRAHLAGSILVMTGHGSRHVGKCQPDHVAEDLLEAAAWIIRQSSRHG